MEKVLFCEPNVSYFHNLFSKKHCDEILSKSTEFNKSFSYNHQEKKSMVTDHRTSSTFQDKKNVLEFHNKQIFELLKPKFWYLKNFNFDCLERIQVLKYEVGEEYKPHHDYFNTANSHVTDNDRIGTMITYLNDDFTGGETEFPELGIKVKPVIGASIFFEYKYIEQLNNKTLHAGLPVKSGTKYIATTWIRTNPYTEKDNLLPKD
jgi:prolyl 4-hydroxylase